MEDRRGVGGGGAFARWGRRLFALFALALCVLAAVPAETRPWRPVRPLDYHATVLNGRIMGSAFQIAEGLAVTNAHVVQGLAPGSYMELAVSDSGRSRTNARLIAVSSRMDLALLAVPPGFLPSVAAENAPVAAGLPVIAAGTDATTLSRPGPRLELEGRVLAPHVDLPSFGPGLVARMPGVRPGFSGGPLLDRDGALVGMVTAIRPGPSPVAPVRVSGFSPARPLARMADEAFVLRAEEIRAEVQQLLASTGRD
jgi:S1-C subfamily serine protease